MTRLFLAVAGTTVGTVTEALWALAVDRKLAIDEIRLLVTSMARQRIEAPLAEALSAMARDYPKARFPTEPTWRVVESTAGPLDDIRDSQENEALADWMLGQVRAACSVADSEVHASLAGGRKTMSFYLGAAMQLCARRQDRLYHVLVPSEFEIPEFLYPRPAKAKDAMVNRRNGETFDARKVKVDLAEVPFVRLAPLLGEDPGESSTFGDLISRADDSLSDEFATVEVRPRATRTEGGGSSAAVILYRFPDGSDVKLQYRDLNSSEFLFYSWLLSRAKEGKPPIQFLRASIEESSARGKLVIGAGTPIQFLRASIEEFQRTFDDYFRWCERLGAGKKKLDELHDFEVDFNDARRKEPEKGKDPPVFLNIRGWQNELKVFPSRIAKQLQTLFQKSAPRYNPEKYLVKHEGGWHMAIPADNIILPKPPKGQR